MRIAIVLYTITILAIAGYGLFAATDANCDWCVSTFCGSSAECPGTCVCAIPQGRATGYCTGTR